ncbi:hypothetical protein [Arthrobacter sp. UM1]|uniref:hypothetical protein n=1 Tax=Arthrobacter sp. UM1 TaxID=2766776 RepID=UPI001CF6B4FB|nr:hypothetical protein [Arthrobacter sp. UM1]MCB4207399.1 hypothetical protein [Arthrobacter sp. UM1]
MSSNDESSTQRPRRARRAAVRPDEQAAGAPAARKGARRSAGAGGTGAEAARSASARPEAETVVTATDAPAVSAENAAPAGGSSAVSRSSSEMRSASADTASASAPTASAASSVRDAGWSGFKASRRRREEQEGRAERGAKPGESAAREQREAPSAPAADRSKLDAAWKDPNPQTGRLSSLAAPGSGTEGTEQDAAVQQAEADRRHAETPGGTSNLAMVTPLDFEKREDGSRGAMKAPPTTSISVVSRPADGAGPAQGAPVAGSVSAPSPAASGEGQSPADADSSAAPAGADAHDGLAQERSEAEAARTRSGETSEAEAAAAETPTDALKPPHEPVRAGDSNGLDPLDPSDRTGRGKRFGVEIALLAGGVASLGAAIIVFLNR